MLIFNKMATKSKPLEWSSKYINYNLGPKFKCERNITKNDIVDLCNYMSSLDFYKDQGIVLAPEAICDGGIVYIFKNNPLHFYKTIRFHYRLSNLGWPWVERGALNTWKDSDYVIFPKNDQVTTILKAFHGAPFFDINEIDLIRDCLEKFGMKKFRKFKINRRLNDIASGPFINPYTPEEIEEENKKPDYNEYYLII